MELRIRNLEFGIRARIRKPSRIPNSSRIPNAKFQMPNSAVSPLHIFFYLVEDRPGQLLGHALANRAAGNQQNAVPRLNRDVPAIARDAFWPVVEARRLTLGSAGVALRDRSPCRRRPRTGGSRPCSTARSSHARPRRGGPRSRRPRGRSAPGPRRHFIDRVRAADGQTDHRRHHRHRWKDVDRAPHRGRAACRRAGRGSDRHG